MMGTGVLLGGGVGEQTRLDALRPAPGQNY